MKFTPEHTQISDTVRKFVAHEINPFTCLLYTSPSPRD